jgi:hypothetical protein
MIKRLFLTRLALPLAAAVLTGCASLQYAGSADYSIEPVKIGDETVCCKVRVRNGKQIDSVRVHAEKRGDDYTFDLEETGVKAFAGQGIAAGAVSDTAGNVLPALLPTLLP